MVQATTPTLILSLPETVDLTQAANVYFTMKQGDSFIRKHGDDLTVSVNTVYVELSQQETLRFFPGSAELQLNWTYADGKRACSDIVILQVGPNLELEVLA